MTTDNTMTAVTVRELLANATPGPWEIMVPPSGCDLIVGDEGQRICEFPYGATDGVDAGNARLIAAAPALAADCIALHARVAELEELVAGLTEDAERYRFIRTFDESTNGKIPDCMFDEEGNEMLWSGALDEAIDKARGKPCAR